MIKHIFNAGPCKLPDMTLENTAKAEGKNCKNSFFLIPEIQIPKNYPKVIILSLGLVSLLERVIK